MPRKKKVKPVKKKVEPKEKVQVIVAGKRFKGFSSSKPFILGDK